MARFKKELSPCDSNGPIDEFRLREWARHGDFQAFVIEPKYDGSRYLLHLHQKGNHLTSRRKSVKNNEYVDRIKQVRHFKNIKVSKRLEGVILDGEVISESVKLAGTGGVAGMLNSKPKRACKLQKKYGKLRFMAFNIKRRKKNLDKKPFGMRRKILEEVIDEIIKLNPFIEKYLLLTPQINPQNWKEAISAYRKALKDGYEGIMIKDGREPDGKGMWKVKVYRDTCAIITGVTKGKGKYKHLIGAVKFSVKYKNKMKEIGRCSGMIDVDRKRFTKMGSRLIGKVIEVRAQEMGAGGRLRHPRFLRLRDDYPLEKCTLAKVRKDLTIT